MNILEEQLTERNNPDMYEHPSVTVDMLVFTVTDEKPGSYRKLSEKTLKLLLIRRGNCPFLGKWALPGGFVKVDESLEDAAYRELQEETGVNELYLEQLYTWGDIGRDPRTRVISASFLALADSRAFLLKASGDSADAKWFSVSSKLMKEEKTVTEKGFDLTQTVCLTLSALGESLTAVLQIEKRVEGKVTSVKRRVIDTGGLAFDHALIIEYGIERLRSKIEYSDIAFNLMPERFTLTELQKVYESILDTELLKANFRRKIARMVLETNESTRDAGHRPSKLFRYNPNWVFEKSDLLIETMAGD